MFKIRFSTAIARYIKERIWVRDKLLPIWMMVKVDLGLKTSGWFDVKKWILSFGTEAELLEPLT